MRAPIPYNESRRLAALHSYGVLDTPPEEPFEEIVLLAARVCGAPMALVSLVDAERQWFKARLGLPDCETHRDIAFCAHAILQPRELLIVEDVRSDRRFADNPLVTGELGIRFYAGAPLLTPEGLPLGTLCVLDRQPRQLDAEQLDGLKALRRFVMTHLELRRVLSLLQERSAELERANAELDAFAATVAHDLRAPLRAVEGFAAALMEDHAAALGQTGSGYLGRIRRAVVGMERLIEDLLEYSRVSRGRITLELVELGPLVAEVVAQFGPELERRDARVQIDGPLPAVRGDRAILSQVVVNLIDNASKFVAAGVRPVVRVRGDQAAGSSARLWIEDNGIGIAPEQQQRVFSVFERLHGVEAYAGTGIGLAFVRKAVERMGGHAGVESAPSGGSRFWFELPAGAASPDDGAGPDQAPELPGGARA